jgi:hypothetical protein
MKVTITFLISLFLTINSYGQKEDSTLYNFPTGIVYSADWIEVYAFTGEKQVIYQKENFYFLYQYRQDGTLQFVSEVETCFIEMIRFDDDSITGKVYMIESRVPGFRVSGFRAQYDIKGEKIVAVAKYKHGNLSRVRRRPKCPRISKYA